MQRTRYGIVLALAAILGGCAVPGTIERPPPGKPAEFHMPPEHVPPLGQCRIWFAELPPEWQPPAMPCARAHELAQRHGGRVVKAISPRSLRDGRTLGFLRFEEGVQEIFAVQVLPGVRFPEMLEWNDDRLKHSYVLPDDALRDVPEALRE